MKHYGKKFQLINELIKKNDPLIVEIGAHFGEDTLRLLEKFPNAEIHCFEPDSRNYSIFEKVVNNDRVTLYNFALSNKEGKAQLFRSFSYKNIKIVPEKYDFISPEEYINKKLDGSGASSLKPGFSNTLSEKHYVNTQRFDTWYTDNHIGKIDFVWIDVQGSERDVINGMGDIIKQIKYIWMEYGETEYIDAMTRDESINLLGEKNFKLLNDLSSSETKGDLVFQNNNIS
jgi:FkbM family methyltransferase